MYYAINSKRCYLLFRPFQIRLHAVLLLHSFVLKLEEEYLPLLPEAMPYIAELSEDENEQIELLVHKLMNEMERILGEPLDKYLR